MKNNGKNNIAVFKSVIKSLANDAANEVDGVSVADAKRYKKNGAEVEFLENDKVSVSVPVIIELGCTVPTTVATVQERVKGEIENATRFRVANVDVEVVSVSVVQ
ncbi:MAG: Asp23/Gls24 family envelope stress response protein [Clostridia bacterium]|nr:Asp23/Gls24 family envelope stress response protein [Clostridia bacterium]